MKAKFGGIEIEGTPEEMAQLVKLVGEMPKVDYAPIWVYPWWKDRPLPWEGPWTGTYVSTTTSNGTNTTSAKNPQTWTFRTDGSLSCANFPLDTAQQATSTAKAVPQTLTIQA